MSKINKLLNDKDVGFKIPKNVHDTLPVDCIFKDGIFKKNNLYSVTFLLTDINYTNLNDKEREDIFLGYMGLINSIDSDCQMQVTIFNKPLNKNAIRDCFLDVSDGVEHLEYRKEYNKLLRDKLLNKNTINQEKYITLSAVHPNVETARNYFERLESSVSNHLKTLDSEVVRLNAAERLKVFKEFYQQEFATCDFDYDDAIKKGAHFKDYFAPTSMSVKLNHLKIESKYVQCLFLQNYANFISDNFINDLCNNAINMVCNITLQPIPTETAISEAKQKLFAIENNKFKYLQNQQKNKNYSLVVPYDMQQQTEAAKDFLDDLTKRDQRMVLANVTVAHIADNEDEMRGQKETITSQASKRGCEFKVMTLQQLQCLQSTLPYGISVIRGQRALTTESCAVFMPFQAQVIVHPKGIYYGINDVNKKPIILDRTRLLNANSFVIGVSGSGKSFASKMEIINAFMRTDDDILVVDPENEFGKLANAFGGTVIDISGYSDTHINPLEMPKDYAENTKIAISEKSEFILSLVEQILDGEGINAKTKSIIDRCVNNIYRPLIKSNFTSPQPTLQDLQSMLAKQREKEAQDVAVAMELFTLGNLNNFSYPTNIDTSNRFTVYNIKKLGNNLLPLGMLIILENIMMRVNHNKAKGKRTWLFIDEFYLLLNHNYSAQFLNKLWRRVRKLGGLCTGMTQNIEDLYSSEVARGLIGNSEFVTLLKVNEGDLKFLEKLLNISEKQLSRLRKPKAGAGLLKVGSTFLPFSNHIPEESPLHQLISTTFKEKND